MIVGLVKVGRDRNVTRKSIQGHGAVKRVGWVFNCRSYDNQRKDIDMIFQWGGCMQPMKEGGDRGCQKTPVTKK